MNPNESGAARMRRLRYFGAAVLLSTAVLIAPASAHFILEAPAASLEQNEIGNPQKLGPCGGTSEDPGTPTDSVTQLTGGGTLHLKLRETVFHPGYYRVALAPTESELPADPETLTRDGPRGPVSVSANMAFNPAPPVLADGLFRHTERPAADTFWEADLTVPNIDCTDCVVQVIQWMAEHGYNPDGAFSYHHCARVSITRNPDLEPDTEWSAFIGA